MDEREFLLMIVQKELEEEYHTCDDKDWLRNLIKAKKWLLNRKRAKGIDNCLRVMEINYDIDKYLNDKV